MNDINSFTPFAHEDLESKNQLIAFARAKDKQKVEEILAATVIYTNLVDYLAQHLLENLRKMCSIANYRQFGAVFYHDPSKRRTNVSLGVLVSELREFCFPDKEAFLAELERFAKTRNRIMHGLMKMNLKSTTNEFDQDLASISKGAEEILAKFNSITVGITTIWQKAFADDHRNN